MYQSVHCSKCGNDILGELLGRKQITACPKCGAAFDPREVGKTQASARRQASALCALITGAVACFVVQDLFFHEIRDRDYTPGFVSGSVVAGLVLLSAFVAYQFFGHWASHAGCAAACIIILLVFVGVLVSAFGTTWLVYGGLGLGGLFGIAAIADLIGRVRRRRQHDQLARHNLPIVDDCEAVGRNHEWYNKDGVSSGCYNCRVVRPGQLWK